MPRTALASVGEVRYLVLNCGNAQREVFHQIEDYAAFPIQQDEHLLTVLRYVERNPLRAKLVERAQDWPWSSLTVLHASSPALILHPGPCPRGDEWLRLVDRPQTRAELEVVRNCVQRGALTAGDVCRRRQRGRWDSNSRSGLTAGQRKTRKSSMSPLFRPFFPRESPDKLQIFYAMNRDRSIEAIESPCPEG
jgi:hypothetical protein